jgi:membrane-associated phospholipid phosphatase
MTEKLARLISNILNPFVISAIIMVLLAFRDAPGTADAVKWALISVAVSVLPVFVVVTVMVYRKKLDGFFSNPRQQRNNVYLLACALGAIDCGLMWLLKAPDLLKATFTAGVAAIIVFALINRFWKISLHTAFMAASVTVVSLVYGLAAIWTVLLFPLVAWARIAMKQHTLTQVVTGGILSAAIVAGVFYGLGVVGN